MPSRRAPPRPPILLLTRIWPTAERPSVGSFIRARASGVDDLRVVRPRWHRLPRIAIYAVLLVDALRAGRSIRGVEAHMLVPTGLVGLLVARLRGVPLVVYAHGGDVRDWRRSFLSRALSRFVARRADRLVTNSRDTAGYLVEMGARPVVVPPGIDLGRFTPTPRPAERRVLYLGGRNPRKGYDVARGLAHTLVGPWLRDVEPAEVPSLLASHDVVLMPSRAEPFGLVAVEAIASGRWVVAGDVGGLRDIIVDGVNGTLVPDGDYAGALARVPDYDPAGIATTVDRFSLASWQAAMAATWDEVAPSPEPAAASDARRVVMLVRNAYTHDTRVEKEARTLSVAGFAVTVVADAGPGLPRRESREGTDIVRVARSGPPIPGVRFLVHQWRLAGLLLGQRPDILHAHDSNALLPVAIAARRAGVPFVYDAHDLWLGRPRRERSRLYFALNQAWYAGIERLLVPRAAATITVSPPIVRHLRDRYGLRHVGLVPNYPEPPARLDRRRLRDLPGGDAIDPELPVVLYLGGLMEGRGLEQLVAAMALLPRAQLVLLGSGTLAEPLAKRAADVGAGERVHLLAPVAPDAVIAHAADADVGVSPIVPSCLNYRYSLPNKLFQYMAAGIPVVASDFPQVRDVVDGARCGAVADMRRPEDIARALAAVLDDPEAARAMGDRGRAAVAERYHWGIAGAVLLETYAGLAPRKDPSGTMRNS